MTDLYVPPTVSLYTVHMQHQASDGEVFALLRLHDADVSRLNKSQT